MPTVPFEKKKKKWYEVEIIITSEQYTQNRESDPNFPWENPKRTIQLLKKKKKKKKKRRYYRKILRISYKDRVTNEKVYAKNQ